MVSNDATKYLNGEFAEGNYQSLVKKLEKNLYNWGAGQRKAAHPKNSQDIYNALSSKEMRANLKKLKSSSNFLEIKEGMRNINIESKESVKPPFKTIDEYGRTLIVTLNLLSDEMMVDNKTMTYPMKILLLLTGFIPALDGQVRSGLKFAGISGLHAPLHMSNNPGETSAKKYMCASFLCCRLL